MRIAISILRYALLISLLVGVVSAANLINCDALFSPQYAGNLATLTDYTGMANITLMIVLLDFSIMSVLYAISMLVPTSGQLYPFQTSNLQSFVKTELLEGVFNVIILVAVGFGALSVSGAIIFFVNVAQLGSSAPIMVPPGTGIYPLLCSYINTNIMNTGFTNWFSLIVNLYVANTMETFTVIFMPNSYGFAYQPFVGMTALVQLLWDDQSAFLGVMFFGAFLTILLFIIDFLFPIFLYVGLALRSFPWTRAAGGSMIAMFFAFYIVFPALMVPFLVLTHPGPGICGGGGNGSGLNPFDFNDGWNGPGIYDNIPGTAFIGTRAQYNAYPAANENPLCSDSDFFGASKAAIVQYLANFNYGEVFVSDVVGFVNGFFFIGLNIFGLVIAILISYEIVEKLGSILGAPSMSAQRALSRIL